MKELMIHVHQIVRPVRAFAGRKLRMQQELLNHLQAALEEERAGGGDESAALDRAKRRLGDSSELCQTLQAGVPWIERTLMARLPVPRAMETFEKRSMQFRRHYPLTSMQSALMVFAATIPSLISLFALALVVREDRLAAQRMMYDHPLGCLVFNISSIILTFGSFAISARYIVAVGSLIKPLKSPVVRVYAGVITALPALWIALLLACINRRAATGRELAQSVIAGIVVLALQSLSGRLIEAMRRPYAEWLVLDVAG